MWPCSDYGEQKLLFTWQYLIQNVGLTGLYHNIAVHVVAPDKMFHFLPTAEFQSHYGKYCNIPRVTADSIFITKFLDSVHTFHMTEIVGP